jgi:acetyltransferase
VIGAPADTPRSPGTGQASLPAEHAGAWRTCDGWDLVIRPIEPSDADCWVDFITNLSPATRHKRGATRIEQLTPDLIRRRVNPDPEGERALVCAARRGDESILTGVGRLVRHAERRWEFMLVVADAWQRRGIGRRLMAALDQQAVARACGELEGIVLATNRGMLELCERLGFRVEPHPDSPLLRRVVKYPGERCG